MSVLQFPSNPSPGDYYAFGARRWQFNDTTDTWESANEEQPLANTGYATLGDLTGYIPLSQKASNNGVATLGDDGKLTASQRPVVDLTGVTADAATAVRSVLTKSDVGLGSVNNTSDSSKPVSLATATALALKAPANGTSLNTVDGLADSATFPVHITDNNVVSGKKISWANIKTTIGAYVATLYISATKITADGSSNGTSLSAMLAGKAAASHMHTLAQISDYNAANLRTKLGIGTLSGSNTGDETTAGLQTKLGLGAANGVPSLDANSKIPIAQIPVSSINIGMSQINNLAVPWANIIDPPALMESASAFPTSSTHIYTALNTTPGYTNGQNQLLKLDSAGKVPMAQLPTNAANLLLKLDGSGLVPSARLPSVTFVPADGSLTIAKTATLQDSLTTLQSNINSKAAASHMHTLSAITDLPVLGPLASYTSAQASTLMTKSDLTAVKIRQLLGVAAGSVLTGNIHGTNTGDETSQTIIAKLTGAGANYAGTYVPPLVSGKIPSSYLPSLPITGSNFLGVIAESASPTALSSVSLGDWCVFTDSQTYAIGVYIATGPSFVEMSGWTLAQFGPTTIASVNGLTGSAIVLDKSNLGLSNVDNTADTNKPASTPQSLTFASRISAAALVQKTVPVSADKLPIYDSAAAGIMKFITYDSFANSIAGAVAGGVGVLHDLGEQTLAASITNYTLYHSDGAAQVLAVSTLSAATPTIHFSDPISDTGGAGTSKMELWVRNSGAENSVNVSFASLTPVGFSGIVTLAPDHCSRFLLQKTPWGAWSMMSHSEFDYTP